jgi:DNA-binding MarR family transcriptional regulator
MSILDKTTAAERATTMDAHWDQAECEAAGHRPGAGDLALLGQWEAFRSGFQALTDDLLGDVEAKVGVVPSSFRVLWFLLTAPVHAAKMHQLAETLNFSTAGTTKVVDRLVEAGLLERNASIVDRRVIQARLTDEGLRVASEAAFALVEALQERVVGTLGAERFADLAAAIGEFGPESRRC